MATGILVALAIGLGRVHVLLTILAAGDLLVVELLRRRAGYVVSDSQSLIALNAPLPGTVAPTMAATVLVIVAVLTALTVPAETVPTWAVVVMGVIVGGAVALLVRRGELARIAAIRRLEEADD